MASPAKLKATVIKLEIIETNFFVRQGHTPRIRTSDAVNDSVERLASHEPALSGVEGSSQVGVPGSSQQLCDATNSVPSGSRCQVSRC